MPRRFNGIVRNDNRRLITRARIYATACEERGKNFKTVPKSIQDATRAIIEADGYVINRDGTVTKAE